LRSKTGKDLGDRWIEALGRSIVLTRSVQFCSHNNCWCLGAVAGWQCYLVRNHKLLVLITSSHIASPSERVGGVAMLLSVGRVIQSTTRSLFDRGRISYGADGRTSALGCPFGSARPRRFRARDDDSSTQRHHRLRQPTAASENRRRGADGASLARSQRL